MADYIASCRSNYFRVSHPESFQLWAWRSGLTVWQGEEGTVAITPQDSHGWPTARIDDGNEDGEDFDLYGELAHWLADGEVAVLMEAGAEKLRVIAGSAVAVMRDEEPVVVSLDSIYAAAAAEFQVPVHRIRRAEY